MRRTIASRALGACRMARGEMVHYLAGVNAQTPEQLKGFDWRNYAFDEARSTETKFVFVR